MSNDATIQKIAEILPHPNADRLEIAVVQGWRCVVKKDEYKAGDYVIFIAIDSIVPATPDFEFLGEHRRIRTCKLRGELSQGLVMPISLLPPYENYEEIMGQDVSDILGVKHYEKQIPATMQGLIKGTFPTHLANKTDETGIQGCVGIIDELRGYPYVATIKMDGTSATYVWDDKSGQNEFLVCSRNWSKKPGDDIYNQMATKHDLANKLMNVECLTGKRFAIQGEICGPGIQGNKMGLTEVSLFVFDVFDVDERTYLTYWDMINFCKELGLTPVPMEEIGTNFSYNLDGLLELAKGNYANTETPREGVVIRPLLDMKSEKLHWNRLSFKVKNNEFLLKFKE